MRKIEFRGYAKEELTGSQWITGGYGVEKVEYTDGTNSVHLITPYGDYEVYDESVGQYTGMKDSEGNKIYEGDIIELLCGVGVVKIGECAFQSYGDNDQHSCICVYIEYANGVKEVLTKNIMGNVVGNIYDNKVLLQED